MGFNAYDYEAATERDGCCWLVGRRRRRASGSIKLPKYGSFLMHEGSLGMWGGGEDGKQCESRMKVLMLVLFSSWSVYTFVYTLVFDLNKRNLEKRKYSIGRFLFVGREKLQEKRADLVLSVKIEKGNDGVGWAVKKRGGKEMGPDY